MKKILLFIFLITSIAANAEELILRIENATQVKSAKLPNNYCNTNFSDEEKDRKEVCNHGDNGSWDIFQGTVGEVISGNYTHKNIKFAFARSYFSEKHLTDFYIRLREPNPNHEKFLNSKYVVKEYAVEKHAMVCFDDPLPEAFSKWIIPGEGLQYCYSLLRLHKL